MSVSCIFYLLPLGLKFTVTSWYALIILSWSRHCSSADLQIHCNRLVNYFLFLLFLRLDFRWCASKYLLRHSKYYCRIICNGLWGWIVFTELRGVIIFTSYTCQSGNISKEWTERVQGQKMLAVLTGTMITEPTNSSRSVLFFIQVCLYTALGFLKKIKQLQESRKTSHFAYFQRLSLTFYTVDSACLNSRMWNFFFLSQNIYSYFGSHTPSYSTGTEVISWT